MATVEIDPGAGFCFGVEQVIRTAESYLRKGQTIYGLGDIVHNNQEIKRLQNLGLKTINHADLPGMQADRVLLRAHGEPPSTFRMAAEHRIEIIDGTCPIVLKLQKKIRDTYRAMDRTKEQLVIFGHRDHPETIGLLGQIEGDAVVVSSPGEIPLVDKSKMIHLFSQTTMDPDLYREVEKSLKNYVEKNVRTAFRSDCTICGQMKKRKPGLRSFARKHDVVVFVSGKNSSNGKMLFEFCHSLNPRSYWISSGSELDPDWFTGAGTIGISGATSTSGEQLEIVSDQVKELISS